MSEETKKTAEAPEQEAKETEAAPIGRPPPRPFAEDTKSG